MNSLSNVAANVERCLELHVGLMSLCLPVTAIDSISSLLQNAICDFALMT